MQHKPEQTTAFEHSSEKWFNPVAQQPAGFDAPQPNIYVKMAHPD